MENHNLAYRVESKIYAWREEGEWNRVTHVDSALSKAFALLFRSKSMKHKKLFKRYRKLKGQIDNIVRDRVAFNNKLKDYFQQENSWEQGAKSLLGYFSINIPNSTQKATRLPLTWKL